MKKVIGVLITGLALLGLTACGQQDGGNAKPAELKVGVIAGPEMNLLEVAQKVALEQYGLKIKIIPFSDYNIVNAALDDGSLDANMFQHLPFLNAQIKDKHYDLAVVGKTFIYPVGIYSHKIKKISELPVGAKVAVPNDPSNEARALLLLQKAGLITLKPGADTNATPQDIASNPKQLQFAELDAAQLPRSLDDVALAVINTNFAVPAGLSPAKDALLAEGPDSPYVNIVVVRAKDKDDPRFQQLVAALHSQAVVDEAKKLFGDGAIPGWTKTS